MKRTIILLSFSIISLVLNAQSGIRIFTKLDEAKFKIIFNGEVENTILIKEITLDSLNHKASHKLIISFTADTIADIEAEYTLLKDQYREFEILKKSEIIKKTAKIGRKIGKALKIGNHDKEAVLYDVYYLEERTKSEYHNN